MPLTIRCDNHQLCPRPSRVPVEDAGFTTMAAPDTQSLPIHGDRGRSAKSTAPRCLVGVEHQRQTIQLDVLALKVFKRWKLVRRTARSSVRGPRGLDRLKDGRPVHVRYAILNHGQQQQLVGFCTGTRPLQIQIVVVWATMRTPTKTTINGWRARQDSITGSPSAGRREVT